MVDGQYIHCKRNIYILGCKPVHVGSSEKRSKTMIIDSMLDCPITVDKTNWLNEKDYGDTYSVTKSGIQIAVTRTDNQNQGWANDLEFRCCLYDGNSYI